MLQRSKVKYIQRLSHKKFRDESGEFVVEGPKLLSELVRERPGIVRGVYALPDWIEANEDLLHDLSPGLLFPVTSTELSSLSSQENPNSVLALVEKFTPPREIGHSPGMVLALEDIRDPGNLGTIIRTADWFGLKHIVCSPTTVDLFNPKVVQSTMGSLFRVHVHERDLADWLGGLAGTAVLGAALEGRSVYGIPPLQSGVLVVGSESHGLSREVLGRCTERVTVPRVGRAESLNASVATGILLSHLVGAG